jgi:hypothetical protein
MVVIAIVLLSAYYVPGSVLLQRMYQLTSFIEYNNYYYVSLSNEEFESQRLRKEFTVVKL